MESPTCERKRNESQIWKRQLQRHNIHGEIQRAFCVRIGGFLRQCAQQSMPPYAFSVVTHLREDVEYLITQMDIVTHWQVSSLRVYLRYQHERVYICSHDLLQAIRAYVNEGIYFKYLRVKYEESAVHVTFTTGLNQAQQYIFPYPQRTHNDTATRRKNERWPPSKPEHPPSPPTMN
jgi:hypothetical protein